MGGLSGPRNTVAIVVQNNSLPTSFSRPPYTTRLIIAILISLAMEVDYKDGVDWVCDFQTSLCALDKLVADRASRKLPSLDVPEAFFYSEEEIEGWG